MNQLHQNTFFQNILQNELGTHFQLKETYECSGGCINNSFVLQTNNGKYFLKYNNEMPPHFFEKEKEGLNLLRARSSIRIPEVLSVGSYQGISYILMEFIEGKRTLNNYWTLFGEQLAEMHQQTAAYFGLTEGNYIGKLEQSNKQHDDWLSFFVLERIVPQVELGIQKNIMPTNYKNNAIGLLEKLQGFFPEEPSSLLHGDLWSGNTMYDELGKPTMIDPAVYYGQREAELAFTTLFGGFDQSFYEAYNDVFPCESGFKDRVDVYNLYPLLVHANLFGSGYLAQVNTILKRID